MTVISPDWSRRRVALAGMRDALSFPAWVVGFGLVGIGSLARDVGYPVEVAVLSTLLVWAGPSQVIFFASIAAGAAWSAIALAIGFASLRFLPMTVAILPLLRRPGQSIWTQLLLAHYVAVTSWVEGLRRLPAMPPEQRVAYFLGFTNTCVLVSATGTFAGYYLLGALPVPLAAGLLCLTPIFFLALADGGHPPSRRRGGAWVGPRARPDLRQADRRRVRSDRRRPDRRQRRLRVRADAKDGAMTQPIAALDGAHWPYLALLLFAFLPTEIWRWLAVAFARRVDADSPWLDWVRAVATALLAGVVAKLIVSPPGVLAAMPLPLRLVALGVTLAIMLADKRKVLLAVLAGEAVLVGVGWFLV